MKQKPERENANFKIKMTGYFNKNQRIHFLLQQKLGLKCVHFEVLDRIFNLYNFSIDIANTMHSLQF